MKDSCIECSTVRGCPFSFTEESEKIQNFGCLPTPMQIISMRLDFDRTWACHSNPDKPCLGAINWLKKNKLPHKVLNPELLTENSSWNLFIKTGDLFLYAPVV